MKTIEGETWHAVLTDEEYEAWVKYDESHPWLANSMPYEAILRMFLTNYRYTQQRNQVTA